MKPEDFGAYYESILENEVRKEGGIYYTPPFIVDYIVKHTLGELLKGKMPKEAEKIKIVDPSCGAGVFLLGAYQFLLDWYQEQLGTLTFQQRKQILLNNIFGVDIDENAVEITKYCLSRKCSDGKSQSFDLTHNIQCGNSVIDNNFYNYEFGESVERLVKPFNWQRAFPQVFKQGGFDAVIGNPPWVSLKGKFGHSIDPGIFAYLIKKYQGNTRMPNLYEYFVHRCLTLINETGLFSFIVPDRLGYNKQFITLRKKILDDYSIKELLYKVPFPGIIADTLIFRFGKKNADDKGKTLLVGEYQHKLQSKSVDEYLADSEYRFQYEIDKHISSVLQKIFTNDRCALLGSVIPFPFESCSFFIF